MAADLFFGASLLLLTWHVVEGGGPVQQAQVASAAAGMLLMAAAALGGLPLEGERRPRGRRLTRMEKFDVVLLVVAVGASLLGVRNYLDDFLGTSSFGFFAWQLLVHLAVLGWLTLALLDHRP